MTFKWTYLVVVVVVVAAVLAPAPTGGAWGSLSYAYGVALTILGGVLIFLVMRRRPRRGRTGEELREQVESTANEIAPPFVGYPIDHVLAIFDREDDARTATAALKSEGFREVDRYAGTRGAMSLDSEGTVHGAASTAERAIERMVSDESDLVEYDEAVRAGGIVLGVRVDDGDRRQDVATIMHRHRGHDARYFGSLASESLSVDPGRVRAD